MTEPLDDARGELLAWHNRFVGWVESWVSNPVSAYSVYALDGLFSLTRDKIARLREIESRAAPVPQCDAESAGLRQLFSDHYWDSFEADKELILKHIDSVLALVPPPSEAGRDHRITIEGKSIVDDHDRRTIAKFDLYNGTKEELQAIVDRANRALSPDPGTVAVASAYREDGK